METAVVQRWAKHLCAVAETAASEKERLGAGDLDEPFCLATTGKIGRPPGKKLAGEIQLWWALAQDETGSAIDVDALIAQPTQGSLLPSDMYHAIEVWTEADLCGLHALWQLARKQKRADWLQRCVDVRRWHMEFTQPDNATNRPWALHVFLLAEEVEGRLYAETLLHNCQAVEGRPDPLSAMILRDAARELELYATDYN